MTTSPSVVVRFAGDPEFHPERRRTGALPPFENPHAIVAIALVDQGNDWRVAFIHAMGLISCANFGNNSDAAGRSFTNVVAAQGLDEIPRPD